MLTKKRRRTYFFKNDAVHLVHLTLESLRYASRQAFRVRVASSFSRSQVESTPAHLRVTQTVAAGSENLEKSTHDEKIHRKTNWYRSHCIRL